MDLHEQSKADSNRREERLMTHLEKTTTELTTITHAVGDIQKEMVRMNDRMEESKKENNICNKLLKSLSFQLLES